MRTDKRQNQDLFSVIGYLVDVTGELGKTPALFSFWGVGAIRDLVSLTVKTDMGAVVFGVEASCLPYRSQGVE